MDKLQQAEAILKKVQTLRLKQKQFFQGKKYVLAECKKLEKEIDEMIAQYWAPQVKLF